MTTISHYNHSNGQSQPKLVQVLKELKQVQRELMAANREHAYLLHRVDELQGELSGKPQIVK